MNVILGLGSNLENKSKNLAEAIKLILEYELLTDIICSAIYESKAVLPIQAPKSWDQTYFNMVIGGNSKIPPYQMLTKIKEIEVYLGRNLAADRWSPRIIDIDILDYKYCILNEKELTIPHKLLFTRQWAIVPFAEIAPDWEFAINPKEFNEAKLSQIITEMKFDDALFMKIGEIE